MSEFVDYYEALQVHPKAEQEVIEKAYKALIFKYHPDRGGDLETAKDITSAYYILSDPARRSEYDRQRASVSSGAQSSSSVTINDIPDEVLDAIMAQVWLDGAAATLRTAGRVAGAVGMAVGDVAFGVAKDVVKGVADAPRQMRQQKQQQRDTQEEARRQVDADFGALYKANTSQLIVLAINSQNYGVRHSARKQLKQSGVVFIGDCTQCGKPVLLNADNKCSCGTYAAARYIREGNPLYSQLVDSRGGEWMIGPLVIAFFLGACWFFTSVVNGSYGSLFGG